MISSQIINQGWSSSVTSEAAGDAMTRAFRTMANVTPSDFDMSNPRFAGGVANITGGDKGGKLGGYGGEEFGAEFEGRLFPYLGEVNWNENHKNRWCDKCNTFVLGGRVEAEGFVWMICKNCLSVLSKHEIFLDDKV